MKALKIIAGLLLVASLQANCQQQDSVDFDVLNAPSNAAFALLGVSPDVIERPTDLNAFRVSIQNASGNFTKFPSNYALEVSPAALLKIKNQTLQKFNSTALKDVFWQSLGFSAGLTRANEEDNPDDENAFTKLGLAVKFSFIRPKWDDTTGVLVDSLYQLQKLVLSNFENESDSIMFDKKLVQAIADANALVDTTGKREKIMAAIAALNKFRAEATSMSPEERAAILGPEMDAIAREAEQALSNFARSGLQFSRKGWFLDFASGMALDFPGDRFNNGMVSKAGAWLTGGYQGGTKFEALAIARYLYQPDKIFADDAGDLATDNISTFDMGAKMVIKGAQGKLAVSTEAIYRSVINKNTIEPNWRLVFNAAYDIGKNQALTFSFGKNFDGTITKDGNLVAAINFIAGFGGNKKYLAKTK